MPGAERLIKHQHFRAPGNQGLRPVGGCPPYLPGADVPAVVEVVGGCCPLSVPPEVKTHRCAPDDTEATVVHLSGHRLYGELVAGGRVGAHEHVAVKAGIAE